MRLNLLIAFFFLLMCGACPLKARQVSPQPYVAFQTTLPIQSGHLGLRAFSGIAGMEHHLRISNQLQFSWQYALTYIRFNQQVLAQTRNILARQQLASDASLNLSLKLHPRISTQAGMGLNLPLYSSGALRNETNSGMKIKGLENGLGLQPYFFVGLETQIPFFRRPLTAYMQIFTGTDPLGNLSTGALPSGTGLHIGLKYKF